MASFTPKYITFDCYGTLVNVEFGTMARRLFAGRVADRDMDRFVANFSSFRYDEVLGDWKPYADVVKNALRRTCKLWNVAFTEAEAQSFYDAVPGFGPHPDVPAGLAAIARHYPLVILSNAADDQIPHNVAKLGAPFHAAYTAQQARAYKPRMQAFEYMFDRLGCKPADVLHVSSSLRYDLMTASDLGIGKRVFVNRNHDVPNPLYDYTEVRDIGGLAAVLGLQGA